MSSHKKGQSNSYTTRNKVKLIRGGKEYFDTLVGMINRSEESIHLQFYIFEDDETGLMVITALKAAARRGIPIFLHIDAYASQGLSKRTIADMKGAGIKVKRFEPLLRSRHFYFGRRLHHKVVVTDGIYSLVGGQNISDRYNDRPGEPAWMDFALYCEGEASIITQQFCRQLWRKQKPLPLISKKKIEEFCEKIPENDHVQVRPRRNDWVERKNQIHKSYMEMFDQANERIIIMCSYFLPGSIYRRKLSRAVKRGVQVDVILAGISDIRIAKNAERYLYAWMLDNRIGIYEYQPTILHAKTAVYDASWVTIGSYNVNNISAHASLEFNMDVKDRSFGKLVEKELDQIIRDRCKKIDKDNYTRTTGFFKRLWQRCCYVFINNVLKLFTFYFKQE